MSEKTHIPQRAATIPGRTSRHAHKTGKDGVPESVSVPPRRRFSPAASAPAAQNSRFSGAVSLMAAGARVRERFLRMPALVQVFTVWALSRIWGFTVFWLVSMQQKAGMLAPGDGRRIGLLEYLGWWDAEWYALIYSEGYPSKLEIAPQGFVHHNTWAFMPAQPKIAGFIADITGIPFHITTVALSVAVSFAAAWVLYLLFVGCLNWRKDGLFTTRASRDSKQSTLAVWAVAAYGFCAPAPIFNTGYAEALTSFSIALFVLLLVQDRYLWAVPVAFLASQSRPVGVPLGALAGLWWCYCLVGEYRARRASRGEANRGIWRDATGALGARWVQLITALLTCFFAFVHPLHAAYKTGRIDAYLATELGWMERTVAEGQHYVVQWFTELHLRLMRLPLWMVAVVVLCGFALYFIWLYSPRTRSVLHPVLVLWCACYGGYLMVFWLPHGSTFRILLPLFPLALLLISYGKDSRAYRWLLILSGVFLQLVWVGWLWHSYGPADTIYP